MRKEFAAVAKSFAPESFERASFECDAERIKAYLREELRPAANASAREIRLDGEEFDGASAKAHGMPAQLISGGPDPRLVAADLIVTRARQTGARVTFIEDAALLAQSGGVGALLRYRL